MKHKSLASSIASMVRSIFLVGISRLKGFSSARTSLKFIVVMLAVMIPASLVFFAPKVKSQNSIVVDTLDDPGNSSECSLSGALENAASMSTNTDNNCAAGTGDDDITFSVSGKITLAATLPRIVHTVTIDGTGQSIDVDGNRAVGIMVENSGANLTMKGLTISNGRTGGFGAGLNNFGGTLAVTDCIFSGNASNAGADGGGIANGGIATITNSTFDSNFADLRGGGIFNGGTMTVTSSTFSNNQVHTGDGAGIFNDDALTVTNSTFFNNQSQHFGGGIYTDGIMLTVTDCTFFQNVANGGDNLADFANSATVNNSILAEPGSINNCLHPQRTINFGSNSGYNMSDDDSCGFGNSTADNGQTIGDNVDDSNIALDPPGVADNGGPTETVALHSGSFGVDAIPIANCPTTDQRGQPRPDGQGSQTDCDIGAFELTGLPRATPTPTATATATNTATATATNTATATATDTATATATDTQTATATPTATATATDTATATATATDTATATPTATATTTLTVTASIAFGNVPVGDSINKNITVKNTGTHALFVGDVTSNDPEFAVVNNNCPGGGLAHLATCTIAIGFTPSGLGMHSGTISVNDNASSSPQHVAVSGAGVADMTVAPTSFMFSSTKIGSKRTKSITVSNKQSVEVSLSEGFSGNNPSDFSVTGGTCMSTLAAKTSCTLIVTYAPTSLSTESANMTVTDSPDTLGPYTVSFTTAENIPATVAPATTLAFGTTTVAHPNKTKNITVTNLSGSSLSVSEGSVGGANAGDFAVTGGTCGSSVAANSTCTIAITFTPTLHATAESASIAVTVGSDPTSPHNIALTGTGP